MRGQNQQNTEWEVRAMEYYNEALYPSQGNANIFPDGFQNCHGALKSYSIMQMRFFEVQLLLIEYFSENH